MPPEESPCTSLDLAAEPTVSAYTIGGKSLSVLDVATVLDALKKAGCTKIKPPMDPGSLADRFVWEDIIVSFQAFGNDGTFALYRPGKGKSERTAGWRTQPGSPRARADQERKAGFEVLLYDEAAEVYVSIGVSSDTKEHGWKQKLFKSVVAPPK